MDKAKGCHPDPTSNPTRVERKSDLDLVVTRTFDAPARTVFAAWTKPELMKLWWAPRSAGVPLLSCEMDVRVGGRYRLVFGHDGAKPMAFFGKYIEVAPSLRLVWTNEESADSTVTTVTLEDTDGRTHLTLHELYTAKEALDEAVVGMTHGTPEQFEQLDALLVTLDVNLGRS